MDTIVSDSSTASASADSLLSSTGPRHGSSRLAGSSRASPTSPPTPPTPVETTSDTVKGKQPSPPGRASAPPGTPSGLASSPSSPLAPRVVYGCGTVASLPTELGRLHLSSPLIVSSPSRIALARRIQALVPNLDSRILDSAVVNVPARVVDDALDRISGRDVVISVGGASAVGLAKAIGGRKGIPHICIPATYSASEMMPRLLDASPARHSSNACRRSGHQASRRKTASHTSTVRDPRILPTVIIYDEELAMSSPKRFPAPSDSAVTARSTEFKVCPFKNDGDAQWSYLHLPGV